MKTQPIGNNESNNDFLNRKQQIVISLLKEHKQPAESMNAFITFEAMEEYGKYCAEKSWKASKEWKYDRSLYIVDPFEDWWNEFKKNENEKTQKS